MGLCSASENCLAGALEVGLQLLELGLVEGSILALPPPFLVLSDVLELWMMLRRGLD
jgi:hypothetical protein